MKFHVNLSALAIVGVAMSTAAPAVAQDEELTEAEKIYAELATLPPEERAKRIEEGAREEGTLSFIHTWRGDLARGHVALFREEYPWLEVEYTGGMGSQDAAERLLAEETAGRHLTDVISMSLGDVSPIIDMVATYPTPATDAIFPKYEGFKDPKNRWVPFYMTEHGLSYNSNMLSAEEAPKTWMDLCDPKYEGMISFEPPEGRFLLGMYEVLGAEKLEEWMKCIGQNDPITQRGHTQRLELMLAGDHAIQGDNYLYKGLRMKSENPSVPFQPVWTAPVHAGPGVVVINENTQHPYASALLADWMLSETSQRYAQERYRGPLALEHPYLPEEVEVKHYGLVDETLVNDLLDKWEKYVIRADEG